MAGGIVLLLAGAEALVRGASALALRVGVAPLVVGLTVVAIGTSSPELVVSIRAALAGNGGVALGNIVGSNIANLGLIVGVAALISPFAVDRKLVRHDVPVMLGASVLMVVFLLDGSIVRWEGALLLFGAVAYTVEGIRTSRRQVREAREVELPPEVETALSESSVPVWRSLLFVVGGVALLVYGANLLLDGAVTIAGSLGVSEAVIGLTLVALGTSLPELATTLVAAVRGHAEIALGNAIGSNIFNILGVLGATAITAPFADAGVGTDSLVVMGAVSVLTFVLLATGTSMKRWEGAVLLVCYVGYIGWLIAA
jgi:cation:H+ antiporter